MCLPKENGAIDVAPSSEYQRVKDLGVLPRRHGPQVQFAQLRRLRLRWRVHQQELRLLGQLGNAELTAEAMQAVGKFLDDPKNLTVRAAPSAPVPFALLAADVMSDPKKLTKTLGVTVTAND